MYEPNIFIRVKVCYTLAKCFTHIFEIYNCNSHARLPHNPHNERTEQSENDSIDERCGERERAKEEENEAD